MNRFCQSIGYQFPQIVLKYQHSTSLLPSCRFPRCRRMLQPNSQSLNEGIQLTLAQGCRTGLPAYVAWRAGTITLCRSQLYTQSKGLRNLLLGLNREPRTVVTLAWEVSRSNHSTKSHLRSHIHTWLDLIHTRLDHIHTRLDLIPHSARSDLHSARSHPHRGLDLIHISAQFILLTPAQKTKKEEYI